jgi:GT2 family glycosyltransferase
MAETVHILLPVHNRREITERFVVSLRAQTHRDYHLILIDDGSSDGTELMVRSYLEDITVIKGKGDWWWAGALQQGYRWLQTHDESGDGVVLIINDDTEIAPDYLSTALEILHNKQRTLLVSRCYDRKTGELVDPGTYQIRFDKLGFSTIDGTGEVNCSSTRGLFLRTGDLFAIGGFYPRLLPHYLSDIEFTYRACQKGFNLASDSRLKLYLDHDATGYHENEYGTKSKRDLLSRYFSRKSSGNPVYWTNFIMLACPWRYKAKNVINTWRSASSFVFDSIFSQATRTDK